MRDLTSKPLIYTKAVLFLLAGTLAAAGILIDRLELRTAILLAVTVWCFARAYYFAFYVIEHYVDPTFRYAGLMSFARYCLRRRSGDSTPR